MDINRAVLRAGEAEVAPSFREAVNAALTAERLAYLGPTSLPANFAADARGHYEVASRLAVQVKASLDDSQRRARAAVNDSLETGKHLQDWLDEVWRPRPAGQPQTFSAPPLTDWNARPDRTLRSLPPAAEVRPVETPELDDAGVWALIAPRTTPGGGTMPSDAVAGSALDGLVVVTLSDGLGQDVELDADAFDGGIGQLETALRDATNDAGRRGRPSTEEVRARLADSRRKFAERIVELDEQRAAHEEFLADFATRMRRGNAR